MSSVGRKRLFAVLWFAVVGAIIGLPLGRFLNVSFDILGDFLAPLPLSRAGWIFGLGCLSLLTWVTRTTRPRWLHFKNLLNYPPTLLAVPMGMALPWIVEKVSGQLLFPATSDENAAFLGTGIAYFVAVAATCRLTAIRQHVRTQQQPPTETQTSPDDHRAWLRNESPVTCAKDDLLNYLHRAERIVRALGTERTVGTGLMQTVVIRGAFGSGKSSVLYLVEECARQKPLIFVRVHCWGFENSTRAREHVVEQCVEALADEVDCTALRDLPRHYVEAITATGSWAASLASLFRGGHTPRDILLSFEPILAALRKHLVVMIEDTDRNGADFDPAHIESMLHDFRSVPRLSFILTVNDDAGYEFPKIAEVIEFLPSLRSSTTLRFLDHVRSRLREEGGYIDPATKTSSSSELRPVSLQEDVEAHVGIARLMGGRHPPAWAGSAAALLTTPRRLKSLLNALERDWPNLRGEVDLDVWIMVMILRHAAPGAFTFLGTHLEDLRGIRHPEFNAQESEKKSHERHMEQLCAAWHKAAERADWAADSAGVLLAELIPKGAEVYGGRRVHYSPNRLQGIHQANGADYWSRIAAGTVAPGEIRDQQVLELVCADDLTKSLSPLAARSVDSVAFAERFLFIEDYLHRIRDKERLQLLTYAHDYLLERHGAKANDDAGGFSILHNGFARNFNSDTLLQPWLEQETLRVASGSLRLANDLMHTHLHARSWAADARVKYVRAVQAQLLNASPGSLAARLDASYHYSLYHLVYDFANENQVSLLTRPTDWACLRDVFIREMELHPATVVPQVIRLIGDSVPPHPEVPKDFYYSRSKLDGIFGDRAQDALSVIARTPQSFPELPYWENERIKMAVGRASNPVYYSPEEEPKPRR